VQQSEPGRAAQGKREKGKKTRPRSNGHGSRTKKDLIYLRRDQGGEKREENQPKKVQDRGQSRVKRGATQGAPFLERSDQGGEWSSRFGKKKKEGGGGGGGVGGWVGGGEGGGGGGGEE